MQQLLCDKANAIDGSFLRELFLQCLPPKVRMVLASTNDTTGLKEFASLADKSTEVATPSVSSAAASQLMTEVEQLRAEITDLKQLVKAFTPYPSQRNQRTGPNHGRSPSPAPRHYLLILVGTTLDLETVPKSANPLLKSWVTARPATSGNRCH